MFEASEARRLFEDLLRTKFKRYVLVAELSEAVTRIVKLVVLLLIIILLVSEHDETTPSTVTRQIAPLSMVSSLFTIRAVVSLLVERLYLYVFLLNVGARLPLLNDKDFKRASGLLLRFTVTL